MLVISQRRDDLPGCRIPNPDVSLPQHVSDPSGNPLPIGTIGEASDEFVRTAKGLDPLSGKRVQHVDRVLAVPNARGAGDPLAVWTERSIDSLPFEGERFRFGRCIPDLDGPVHASADDPLAIRTEAHTGDAIGMPSQDVEL